MPLFSRRNDSKVDDGSPSPEIERDHERREQLRTGGLLSSWFIQYRLEEEVERALRYGRPLAVVMAEPHLLRGERLSRAARDAAADAAMAAARSTDLVGWADEGDGILIIMPETDPDLARIGAMRVRDEIWRRGRAVSAPKWDISFVHDPDAFRSPLPHAAAAVERIDPAA
ncbi:MAG: hypothetical protein WEB52_09495 [Dehalococcoidia bacterium]